MPGGQYINHFGQVRVRVTGTGVMSGRLLSLDDENSVNLPNITLQSTTARYVNALTNFETQKARLELKTTEFGATFFIRSIILYVKPVGMNYPQ